MRTRSLALLLLLLVVPALVAQEESAQVLARQKKDAEDAWKAMDLGAPSQLETQHLRLVAAPTFAPRLKVMGPLLEKYHEQACRALGLAQKEAHPGKITIYLFDSREQVPTFARRIQKRRPTAGENASFLASDEQLHVAAAPGTSKTGPAIEALAGEMVAALLLQRRAKVSTSLPEWLPHGFGRATSYRVLGNTTRWVADERKQARLLVRKCSASDVWDGKVEGEESLLAQASLAEFLTYGAGPARLEKFLAGFIPDENMESRSVPQALESAGLTEDRVNKTWKAWVK
jgi:hypothetical protein